MYPLVEVVADINASLVAKLGRSEVGAIQAEALPKTKHAAMII